MLGQRLRELRESAGETRFALASLVHTTPSSIYNIEMGISKNPHIELVARIAKHFRVTVDYLLGITDEPENKKS